MCTPPWRRRGDAAYPDDTPYPSRLLLGWRGDKPLHVVAAYNAQDDEQIVITVYEPDSALGTMDSEGESNEMRGVQAGGDAPGVTTVTFERGNRRSW